MVLLTKTDAYFDSVEAFLEAESAGDRTQEHEQEMEEQAVNATLEEEGGPAETGQDQVEKILSRIQELIDTASEMRGSIRLLDQEEKAKAKEIEEVVAMLADLQAEAQRIAEEKAAAQARLKDCLREIKVMSCAIDCDE